MFEVGPQHPVTYRQEIVQPLFDRVIAGESCCVIGAASMGKSRLLQHITRRDIQGYFLGSRVSNYFLVLTDCNRANQITEWGLYELLLTSMIEACMDYSVSRDIYEQLNNWRMTVLAAKKDPAIAFRQLELAIRLLVRKAKFRLIFLMDDFDKFYSLLPSQALANLRSLRDANKYHLTYILFLRNSPSTLRDPSDGESFYELFSRMVMGLRPYSRDDAMRVIEQIRQRRNIELSVEVCDRLGELSGGCPGLIVTLVEVVVDDRPAIVDVERQSQLISRKMVEEECQKIWDSLPGEEQTGVVNILAGNTVPVDVRQRLELKGIISTLNGVQALFSPVFADFVRNK